MPHDLPKAYDPTAIEDRWSAYWVDEQLFDVSTPKGLPEAAAFTMLLPPPNVTGILHMGHMFEHTETDILVRWRRMCGRNTLWLPGTDHAGIATQAVVERRMLEEEGLTRHEVGREALVNRIWKWKDAYEDRILGQLKQLGSSCDWRRTRFTLDDICSFAVRRTFFKFFSDGLTDPPVYTPEELQKLYVELDKRGYQLMTHSIGVDSARMVLDAYQAAEKINGSYVGRMLRLTLLAPDIVEAILTGRQPAALTLGGMMKPFPMLWKQQGQTFG